MMGSPDDGRALAAEWDQRYTSLSAQIPDGEPSAVLIAEVSGLQPGRALEIGCGIGTDAIWLASHGWTVTGLDVSQIALERARARAREAGVEIEWVHSRLEDAHLPPKGFDLVTAHYPALLHSPGHGAETALLGAVAPGGTLLVVHHADIDIEKAKSYGFDPADYVSHDDIVELLNNDWDIRIERRRARDKPIGIDLQHTHDDVVRPRRL